MWTPAQIDHCVLLTYFIITWALIVLARRR